MKPLAIDGTPLLQKETPYYRRKCLTNKNKQLMKDPTIEGSPLLMSKSFKPITYYRKKPLTILQNQIPYYIRKPLTMERTPSLTIEGHPLLIRKSFKEIPYYRNNSLTIEGNALRIKTHNSWKSFTIEGRPLLISNLFKQIPYYSLTTLSILSK